MKFELPECYIALVLRPNSEPSKKELEGLRLATVDYLVQQLQTQYPELIDIELGFSSFNYGAKKPEPRFNVYIEACATAVFTPGTKPPTDTFDRFISAFDRDYLIKIVRQLEDGKLALASAVEVQARRLKRPTQGGTVKAPAFYMGFVCSNEPTREPTEEEKAIMLAHSHVEATRQLKQAYPDDFSVLSLNITKTAIGPDAGKPEAKFILYVEFEAVATFVQNAPKPMDIFQALSACVSMDFLLGLRKAGGSFSCIMEMAIRVCIWIEIPELLPAVGVGEGEPLIIKIHIEFFVALVVRLLDKAPTPAQLEVFDKRIQKFFSAVMAASFPSGFLDMTLEGNHEYGAGLPLPRFNLLHPYKATMQFYDPAPDGAHIMCKIVQCNVGALFDTICKSSAPWNNTGEVTLGTAVEKPPTDDAYGGKLELDEPSPPPLVIEEPPPQKVEEKKQVVKLAKKAPPVKPKPANDAVSVFTSDVFSAFTLPQCDIEPYQREYKALANATQTCYANHLREKFADSFQDVTVSPRLTLFGVSKPNDRYNIYIEWDISARFKGENVPNRHQLCRSLVNVDCHKYLTEYVRSLSDTPFSGTIGMFTEQVNTKVE